MADFSSLKATIRTYVKQNGNEEITGNILQDVLLAMVSTMGDSAINSLASAFQDEIAERQNQDGILQGNITAEATARRDADTALGGRIDGLQTAINGINTKLAEGYIYAGIATPSTNPGIPSGKVFYIAIQAGTYTNFGGTVVTEGITILKYNGTSWVKEQAIFTDGGVFDISAYHATGGTLAKYVDLAAALDGGNNIPQSVRKGGMSIKFVQSFDKYVQYRLMADEWSINTEDWAIADDGTYIENPEYSFILADAEGKMAVALDKKGNVVFGSGVPPQIKKYIENLHIENKVDKVGGKSLINSEYSDSISVFESPEFIDLIRDNELRILKGVKKDEEVVYVPTNFKGKVKLEDVDIQGKAIEQIKDIFNDGYINVCDGTVINNALHETVAMNSQIAFDLQTGIVVVWDSSAWLQYGEVADKSSIIVFPLVQPDARKYIEIDRVGEEYTASIPWNGTTRTFTSIACYCGNILSLGNGRFRIIYYDDRYVPIYRDYDYINDTLTEPIYIELNYNGGNMEISDDNIKGFLTEKGIDITTPSVSFHYDTFVSPLQTINGRTYCVYAGYNVYPVLFSSTDGFQTATPFAVFPEVCDYEACFCIKNNVIHFIGRSHDIAFLGYKLAKSSDNGATWQIRDIVTGDSNRPRLLLNGDDIIIGYGILDSDRRQRHRIRFEKGTDIFNMEKMFDLEDRWGLVYFSYVIVNGELYLVWSDAQPGLNVQTGSKDLRNCMKYKRIDEYYKL